jgi:hypothetical protein
MLCSNSLKTAEICHKYLPPPPSLSLYSLESKRTKIVDYTQSVYTRSIAIILSIPIWRNPSLFFFFFFSRPRLEPQKIGALLSSWLDDDDETDVGVE